MTEVEAASLSRIHLHSLGHPADARPIQQGRSSRDHNQTVSLLKNVYPHEIQALNHVVTDRLIHDTTLFQLYHTMN